MNVPILDKRDKTFEATPQATKRKCSPNYEPTPLKIIKVNRDNAGPLDSIGQWAVVPSTSADKNPQVTFQSDSSNKHANFEEAHILEQSTENKNICSVMAAREKDTEFLFTSDGMDNKTMFLLITIKKYESNKNLQHLLSKDSQNLLKKFIQANTLEKKLLSHLCSDEERWHREETLKGMGGCNDKINNLIEQGFLDSTNREGANIEFEFEDYLDLLEPNELSSIWNNLKFKTADWLRLYCGKKSSINPDLIASERDNLSEVLNMMRQKTSTRVRVSKVFRQTINDLLQLMYPCIMAEKLNVTNLITHILSCSFPDLNMPPDDASVVFNTRDDFLRYMQAQNVYFDFLKATDIQKKIEVMENAYNMYKTIDRRTMSRYIGLPSWLYGLTPPFQYVTIMHFGLCMSMKKGIYESLNKLGLREKYVSLALNAFTLLVSQKTFMQNEKVDWYIHTTCLIRVYLQDVNRAAKVLLAAYNSDISETMKYFLRMITMMMVKQLEHSGNEVIRNQLQQRADQINILLKDIYVRQLNTEIVPQSQIIFKATDGQQAQIMKCCIESYTAESIYAHGEHWGSSIVTTIFFLLFWDVIYARLVGLRGLYLTHYQMYPLDLFLENFYVNRKALIDERLKEIEESTVEDVVESMSVIWNSRPEGELSGISRHIGWENVRDVSSCLGPRALAVLCRRLARDYQCWQSGFPDLTLWDAHTKQIKFVAVFTSITEIYSNKLLTMIKQTQWMHYMQENGIKTEICYVGTDLSTPTAANSINSVLSTATRGLFQFKIKDSDTEIDFDVNLMGCSRCKYIFRTAMFAVYVPLAVMSAVSAASVIYLYCKNRINRRKGYMDVNEKP